MESSEVIWRSLSRKWNSRNSLWEMDKRTRGTISNTRFPIPRSAQIPIRFYKFHFSYDIFLHSVCAKFHQSLKRTLLNIARELCTNDPSPSFSTSDTGNEYETPRSILNHRIICAIIINGSITVERLQQPLCGCFV